jgi:hypothetical protein
MGSAEYFGGVLWPQVVVQQAVGRSLDLAVFVVHAGF